MKNAFQNSTKKDNNDKSNDETIPYAVAQPTTELSNGPQTFSITNDWFGRGDAQITTTGPNTNEEVPCFKMMRTGGNSLLCNSKLVLTDLADQPLLSLKEYRYKSGVAMEVCHTNGSPLGRIYREGFHLTIKNRYKIEVLEQFAAHQHRQYPAGITCIGHSLPYRFELIDGQSGQELARIKKGLQLLSGGVFGGSTWQLDLPAGVDAESVVFFLGITCAIDRIHTDNQKRK